MQEKLWAALREVMDPEMPLSIVDLGLVYGIEEQAGAVTVKLTLTAMGCPGSDFIFEDIRTRLLQEPEVQSVAIDLVWSPPWTSARISEEGRDALEMWGLAL
jgi:metal-sulfur cluster biosynthetic enzyme